MMDTILSTSLYILTDLIQANEIDTTIIFIFQMRNLRYGEGKQLLKQ